MSDWVIGVIGGSGLYAIDALEDAQWIAAVSPWGQPSDALLTGTIAGVKFVFLPRHGRGHRIAPGELNARANIDVLKRAGVTDIVSISAVGSLAEELPPGRFVIVDQFIDRTKGRPSSFFESGMVAHVSMADPVCPRLRHGLVAAAQAEEAPVHDGGCYVAIDGPQFSTRAESRLYQTWGGDVIGMTGMPEARLAREAELPYAMLGMVTDYDSWRAGDAGVEASNVLEVMHRNVAVARRVIGRLAASLPATRSPSPIDAALSHAIMTAPAARDAVLVAKLQAVAGRMLK